MWLWEMGAYLGHGTMTFIAEHVVFTVGGVFSPALRECQLGIVLDG